MISAASMQPSDPEYMQTGLYYLTSAAQGITMMLERSDKLVHVWPLPIASIENVIGSSLDDVKDQHGSYTALYLDFDAKGAKDLMDGTGDSPHPYVAIVVANKLLYVARNNHKLTTGTLAIVLDNYSREEMEAMLADVRDKL